MSTTGTNRIAGTPSRQSMDRFSGVLLLSGDATDGDDALLLSGDATDGDDRLLLSGRFYAVGGAVTDRVS